MSANLKFGDVLARSYRLLHPIGVGGMGRVWVAEHMALDRRVAVKVMSEEALETPVARELFVREARATAKVESPNVVRVLDFDVTETGFPFMVLELLDGETLEDRIARSGPLSLGSAEALLEQVTHALDAAHSRGILHRDIKAENIFLVGDRAPIDVRLLDFGVATTKDSNALLRGPVGTLCYMSPEQIIAADVDERSDLFSLAICMYYALTARFPFDGSTLAEFGAALTRRCAPVTALRSELPRGLDAWFSRALARDRCARFSSATEMCEAFVHSFHRDTPLTHEIDIEETDLRVAGVPRYHPRRWVFAVVACAVVALGMTHRRELERVALARPTMTTERADDAMMPDERTVAPIHVPLWNTPTGAVTRPVSTVRPAVTMLVVHRVRAAASANATTAPPATAEARDSVDPNDVSHFGGRE